MNFLPTKFKSEVNFHRPWLESLDNTENFPDYREYQIRRQGSLVAGCDGTHSATSALLDVPRCMLTTALSCRTKLHFGLEKLINFTLFAAGGNDTLELISNWTSEFFLFRKPEGLWNFRIIEVSWFLLSEIDTRFGFCRSKDTDWNKKNYFGRF